MQETKNFIGYSVYESLEYGYANFKISLWDCNQYNEYVSSTHIGSITFCSAIASSDDKITQFAPKHANGQSFRHWYGGSVEVDATINAFAERSSMINKLIAKVQKTISEYNFDALHQYDVVPAWIAAFNKIKLTQLAYDKSKYSRVIYGNRFDRLAPIA